MPEFLENVRGLGTQSLLRIVEFAIVWYVIYRLLLLVRGTRAWPIMGGLLIFGLMYALSGYLHMHTLYYLLEKASVVGGIALVVLFFPELRQALEQFGSVGPWAQKTLFTVEQVSLTTVEEIVAAVTQMSMDRTGALIVVERASQLAEVEATGTMLQSRVSGELLESIFLKGSPLHDGAVVIRSDTIIAAACQLPISTKHTHPEFHMRHRAAIGVTEGTDALAIVVSEENGRISISIGGQIDLGLKPEDVRTYLNAHINTRPRSVQSLAARVRAARIKRMRKEAKSELPQA